MLKSCFRWLWIAFAFSFTGCGSNGSWMDFAQSRLPGPEPTGKDVPILAPSPSPSPTPAPKPPTGPIPGEPGVCGDLYDISALDRTCLLPDFDKLTPIGRVVLPEFSVESRTFRRPFPGVPGNLLEWYAIRFRGSILAPITGVYEFELKSDDGSRLIIDGKTVIDHDGVHPGLFGRIGRVDLSSGEHDFELDYFQGPRHCIALVLLWTPPDTNRRVTVPRVALRGFGSDDRSCF